MKENKKVLVSGCYDGVHDGQKYFLEIAATYGLLFVSIATDKTIIDLKNDEDEDFELLTTQEERLKEIGDMDWVHEAFISTGMGEFNFLDDLERIKPNILLVNKDGDSEAKRDLCIKHDMEYVVLERIPRPGSLPITSTQLREEKKHLEASRGVSRALLVNVVNKQKLYGHLSTHEGKVAAALGTIEGFIDAHGVDLDFVKEIVDAGSDQVVDGPEGMESDKKYYAKALEKIQK